MLTVEDYGQIRRAYRDGLSIRQIAQRFHHSRRKVRQVLRDPEPKPYTRTRDRPCPVLGPFQAFIEQMLADDERTEAPRKQRHTAAKVYRRLRDEYSYPGSYVQVRRYVRRLQKGQRRQGDVFIPLAHDPGQRLECDFGHVSVDFPSGRSRVPVLQVVWSFSSHLFSIALPTERIEAILDGMVQAFEFFGCVSHEVWWDNPRTVAPQILQGRQRGLHSRYQALASHYLFEPLFCMVRCAQEKPYVENSVFDLQRDWCTPVPQVTDLGQLNAYLRQCCLRRLQHTVSGQNQTVGERFAQDKAAALALAAHRFDPCLYYTGRVDKYQLVRFDTNQYSVPRRWAFETVTIKAYVDRIDLVAQDAVVASHPRCYQRGQQILDPRHYLATLGRRPAALDHSNVFGRWQLPACFEALRHDLEARDGLKAGARQYIRVLQLLADHPAQRVQQAIESCQYQSCLNVDLIIQQTARLAARQSGPDLGDLSPGPQACHLQVPRPDLTRFNELLTPSGASGEPCYART